MLEECLPQLHRLITQRLEITLPPFENNVDNLKKNVVHMEKRPCFSGNPIAVINCLIDQADAEQKAAITEKLLSYGCTDPASTKQVLSSWIEQKPLHDKDAAKQLLKSRPAVLPAASY